MVRGQATPVFLGFLFGLFAGISFRFSISGMEETIMGGFAQSLCSVAPLSCKNLFSAVSLILFLFGIFEILKATSEDENPIFSVFFYFVGSLFGLMIAR